MQSEARGNTKKRFVEETYKMILEVGVENIRVRDIAKRVGCTAAALYKHFENLNELIILASVKFLDPYREEIRNIIKSGDDPIEIDIAAWHCFNRYAFANPHVFLYLFWGNESRSLESAFEDYYELYPTEIMRVKPDIFYYAEFSGGLEERDFIWLRRGAVEGRLSFNDAQYISRVNALIVRGMLMEHRMDYKEEGVAEQSALECSKLIEKTIRTYLKK